MKVIRLVFKYTWKSRAHLKWLKYWKLFKKTFPPESGGWKSFSFESFNLNSIIFNSVLDIDTAAAFRGKVDEQPALIKQVEMMEKKIQDVTATNNQQ